MLQFLLASKHTPSKTGTALLCVVDTGVKPWLLGSTPIFHFHGVSTRTRVNEQMAMGHNLCLPCTTYFDVQGNRVLTHSQIATTALWILRHDLRVDSPVCPWPALEAMVYHGGFG